MLRGLTHLLNRAVRQSLIEPKRRREFNARAARFTHQTSDGLVFELEPGQYVDRVIAVEGIFERRFLGYLKSILPDDAVMLDIGANIGNHAIFVSRKCREIHCFEPNPPVADRLRRNIAANGLAHKISVHQFGLGARDESLTFYENTEGNLGASGFVRDAVSAGHRALQLQVKRADRAIDALRLDRIDYIKIDVEGMEEAVITSLAPVIDRCRPLVTFEHHEERVQPGTFSRIRAALPGYRLLDISFAPEGSTIDKLIWNLRHNGGPVLAEILTPERRSYDNILAVPHQPK